VSSEQVERGKPEPDVYLETARRMNVDPAQSAAVEDSENGIRSAKAAGMYTVALPNEVYPPAEDALAQADAVISSLDELQHALEAEAGDSGH
jgi:beta-phosphoglucomutase-like phosphatase (HAD superfamily)